MSVEDEKLNGAAEEQEVGGAAADTVETEVVEGVELNVGAEETVGAAESVDSEPNKDWKAEALALAEQVETYKDQALRVQAEMQNIRRRSELDVEKAHKFGVEKFAKELLPIIDSLEKAIEAEVSSGSEVTPLREGVELTLSMFLSGIKKFGLEQVEAVGQPFNPEFHEAMSMIDAPGAEPNTVIAEMQKGYLLSGRLLRPAMVVIAKA